MKVSLPGIVTVASLSAMAGCASAPTSPTSPSAPAPAAAVPARTALPLTADVEATLKGARALGYVPRNHHGTIVYCRSEPQIGTRLESTTCISQEQVASVVQRTVGNRESVEDMQRKSLNGQVGN